MESFNQYADLSFFYFLYWLPVVTCMKCKVFHEGLGVGG